MVLKGQRHVRSQQSRQHELAVGQHFAEIPFLCLFIRIVDQTTNVAIDSKKHAMAASVALPPKMPGSNPIAANGPLANSKPSQQHRMPRASYGRFS